MQRILVLGNAGAGKTHASLALGRALGLPVVHLDRLFWAPGWTLRASEERQALQRRALDPGGRWIADGNYVSTLGERLRMADAAIVLDVPTTTCLRRVLVRTARSGARDDLPPGCEERLLRLGYLEFLRYVATFRRKALPRVLDTIARTEHRARVVQVRGRASEAAIAALVRSL